MESTSLNGKIAIVTGGSNGNNQDDIYQVVLPAGKTSISATLSIQNYSDDDLDLFLLRDTCVASSCVDASWQNFSSTEYVSSSGAAGQRFFVVIEEYTVGSNGNYSLSISCD